MTVVAACLCALLAVLAPNPCAAQSSGERRPAFAQREARLFDFEEIESNPAPVPMFWVRAQDSPGAGRDRPGFPIWNAAELDGTHAHSGVGAVKLPTQGGSTSLLLERGVLPIFQRADYVLTAQVLTDGLKHARARLVARLLDADGRVVDASERQSNLIVSQNRWTLARVEIPGDYDNASFLQIELQVLQPSQYQARTLGSRQVYDEDFDGAAWFDDVSVAQLPRIEISTSVQTNVFIHPAAPDINFLVRDLTGERLTVHLSVADAQGATVDQESRRLTTGRTLAAWRPSLKRLGWYRATLTVNSDATVLATTSVDFLWIGPQATSESASIRRELSGSTSDWRRFELVAIDPHPQLSAVLVDLVTRVGVGSVTVPVWEGLYDAQSEEAGSAANVSTSLVTRLLERGRQVALSLPRLPKDLADAAKVDPEDPWELARRGPELWGPFVDRYLDRFGQSIRRWEVGPPWDDRVFWDVDRRKTLASVVRIFERLVPGPILCVPWRADLAATDEILGQLPREAALRVFVPEDMPSGSIAALMPSRAGIKPGAHDLTVVLGTSFDSRLAMREGASEISRRLAEFWRVFGDDASASVALLQPWTWTQDQRPQISPKPELAALATLIPRLSGRRFVGELPAGPGIRALVFSPAGSLDATDQGVLIAWNESGMPRTTLRAYLGTTSARPFDIFGNAIAEGDPDDVRAAFRTVRAGSGRTPEVILGLTDEPVIVEGVDPRMALFQAGVRIEPPFIEASSKVHAHWIVVQNPWPVPVEVNIRVIKPGGVDGADARRDRSWRVTPRQARIVVDPGREERIPVELSFSPGEEAGTKEFVMDVEAAADQSLGSLRIHRDLELGSSLLDLQLSAKIDENQNVVVETYVSNRGRVPVDLQLTAFAPGLSRIKSVVTNLLPGGVGVRAFSYDRAGSLRGERVYVTLEDVAGSVRINKAVVIE